MDVDLRLAEGAFLGRGRRGYRVALQGHTVELVQSLDHEENHKSQDQEIDQGGDEAAIADHRGAGRLSVRAELNPAEQATLAMTKGAVSCVSRENLAEVIAWYK